MEESYATASKLAIFDFDMTTARTVGFIIGTSPTGENVRIETQAQYDKYKKIEGFTFDYTNLENIAYENDNMKTAEIRQITKLIKQYNKDDSIQVMILTAREDKVKSQIQDFLTKVLGISLEDEYVKGMAGASKGDYVFGILKQYPNIKEVEFYDDSKDNIDSVQAAVDRAIEKNMIAKASLFHVDPNGNPREV